ncbi:MAG: AAA family ATPase [Undibacterium sp.]|nr:AAA family ATPase [Opitutaceae bacterium]
MNKATENIEAENFLLSCVLIESTTVIAKCLELGITEDSFVDARHKILWRTMHGMLMDGNPVDCATVLIKLRGHSREMTEAAIEIGRSDLIEIHSAQPTIARAVFFAKAVRDAAILRNLVKETAGIDESVREAGAEPAEVILHNATRAILSIEAKQHAESWAETQKSVMADFETRIDPNAVKADDETVSWGFACLDKVFGPMRCGQMNVIAARPSVGKSSLARQVAIHCALKSNQQVLFASLEVMGRGLLWNMAQTMSNVSAQKIGPTCHPKDLADFKEALGRAMSPRLEVLAASSVSLAAIKARCEVLRAKGAPPRLIVIDYIGLMPDATPEKGENRAQSVGRVSRALKRMALENNCVVLVISQLNRDSAKDESEPQIHHLRESGDIEQDADKIVLLHRPACTPSGAPQPAASCVAEIPSFFVSAIQAKGRDDGTGSVGLNFRRTVTRFESIQA